MTGRGRHARPGGLGFYKDVLLLIGGIILVAAVVFGGLSLWAGGSDDDVTSSESTTTTEAPDTSPTTSPGPDPTTSPTPATSTTAGAGPSTAATSTAQPTTTTSEAPPSTLREARNPGEVRVVVLNSIGVTGLAGQLSDELAQLGYQMAEADNYTPELSDSMIFHTDGFSVEALDLADSIPDATVAPDPELAADWGVDLVVVIGQSYQE